MKISYDGPPDFDDEMITIKIELQPSEVADVVRKLLGQGAVELVRDQLPPECPVLTLDDHVRALVNASTQLTSDQRSKLHGIAQLCNEGKLPTSGGTPGATQWNG